MKICISFIILFRLRPRRLRRQPICRTIELRKGGVRLKVSIRESPGVQTELVIHCTDRSDPQVQALLKRLRQPIQRLPARGAEGMVLLAADKVLYGEFINRNVFVYTADVVLPSEMSLSELEAMDEGFFRCSKSMVVNLREIIQLKPELGGRILATLSNGERIVVSRHYASALRRRLSIRKER